MRVKYLLFFLLVFSGGIFHSAANHLVGGEIQVDVLKPDTFVVTMTLYRECGGIQTDSTENIALYSYGCSPVKSANTSMHLRKTEMADFLCSDSLTPCLGGSFPYGIQARIYIDTFCTAQLFPSGVSCCDLFVFYEQCCRSAQVSPPFPGKFHIETKFNRCIPNRAPQFTDYPRFVIKSGFYFNYSRGTIDTVDVDSFSFEEVAPLTGHDTDLASPFWSTNNPIYLGYPTKVYPCPAGYSYNKATNDWYFSSAGPSFQQSLAFEIKEWRKINGSFINISTIRSEILLSNLSTPPASYFSGNDKIQLTSNLLKWPLAYHVGGGSYCYAPHYNYFETKVGQLSCFYIKAAKVSGTDSVRIMWNGGLPGAAFNSLNKNSFVAKEDSARICWTPDFNTKHDAPYYFTYMVKGQECPVPTQFSQTILVKVYGFTLNRAVTKTGPGQYLLSATVPSLFTGSSVSWVVSLNKYGMFDSINAANYPGLSVTHSFTANGKYVIRSRFNYPPYGTFDFFDTVTVCDFSPVAFAGNDTSLCLNKAVKMGGSPAGGTWSGAVLQNDTFYGTTPGNYVFVYSIVADTFGCAPLLQADTLHITIHPAPTLPVGPDTVVCHALKWVSLHATPSGGSWMSLTGIPMNGNLFNANQPSGKYPVLYTISDSNSCTATDTISVDLLKGIASFSPSTSSGNAPLQVTFLNTSDTLFDQWLWNFGNGPADTSSLKQPNYTFLMQNRFYTITLIAYNTVYGCTDTAYGSVFVLASSVYSPVQLFSVYPNPAFQVVYIDMGKWDGVKTIVLTDISGKKVLETETESTVTQLAIEHLSKGIYLLTVLRPTGEHYIQKLVVE